MRFALAVLLFATAALAISHPLCAAMCWTIAIAFLHMVEETQGRLWAYFGETVDFPLLKRLPPVVGFLLIVAPAFLLQSLAAFMAFSGGSIDVFWLSVLIGARLGDAVFSHAIPVARGQARATYNEPGERLTNDSGPTQLNPGLATAVIYLVDGLLLTVIWSAPLLAMPSRELAVAGFAVGAGFFALVLPGLQLLSRASRLFQR